MPIVSLSREYVSRHGQPRVSRVDTAIFVRRYFMRCMECTFCNDVCCRFGVDVDAENVARLHQHAAGLEAFTGISREQWFTGQWREDADFPGGKHTRTRVQDGRCVFLNRAGRGCLVHSYCASVGLDYQELKPMVSTLFPVTFDRGLLHASLEIEDGDLVCIDQGPTVYRGVRDELAYYFGPEIVVDLDAVEHQTAAP